MHRKENIRSWVHHNERTLLHSPIWSLRCLKSLVRGSSKDPWLLYNMARKVNQLKAGQAKCRGQPHFTHLKDHHRSLMSEDRASDDLIFSLLNTAMPGKELLGMNFGKADHKRGGNSKKRRQHSSKWPWVGEMIKIFMLFLWLLCELEIKLQFKFSLKWGSAALTLLGDASAHFYSFPFSGCQHSQKKTK